MKHVTSYLTNNILATSYIYIILLNLWLYCNISRHISYTSRMYRGVMRKLELTYITTFYNINSRNNSA